LIHSGKVGKVRGETKQGRVLSWNREWCSKHTLSKGSGRATNRLVGIRDAHKKQEAVGEALGTKERNLIESTHYKRKR